MGQTKTKKLKELTPDPKNANKHTQFGSSLLENSTRLNGLGRSIVISEDNFVIAGNDTLKAAGKIGIQDVEIVESDGTKLVAVKRTDIKSGTPEFYNMALADNIVAQKNIVMDVDVVEAIAKEHPSTEAWAGIVTDPPGSGLADHDKANHVTMTFQLSSSQAAKVKQAIKISKDVNKAKVQKADNENANGNALYWIVQEWIKTQKKR